MNGFLLEQRIPGATTCLVVGEPRVPAGTFIAYREVLWCADGGVGDRPPVCFAHAKVHRVGLGFSADERATALNAFVRRNPRHLPALFVSETVLHTQTTEYEQLLAELYAQLEQHQVTRWTRQKDGFRWQQHLLRNLAAYTHSRVPEAWRNALRDIPAFVCGAGPSLDVSAPVLAAHAPRGVVFSADSALRTLARHGVRADFAASIDAAKVPEKCLPQNAEFAPRRVVLSAVSPPAWTTAVTPEYRSFLYSYQITLDWLATHGIPATPLTAHENCGNTALELARFMGCAPIYLFGLDLAVASDNRAARNTAGADASLYANSGYNSEKRLPRVPGNYADEVPTFALGDWRALDTRLASWPKNLVYNVNDRGAMFRNTTLVHPRDFALPASKADKSSTLAALASPAAHTDHTYAARLRNVGERAGREIEPLRACLRERGPAAVAERWRRFLADRETGQVFGAFSLKLMPHLLPPIEGDAAFWSTLLDEFAELAGLAAAV